MLIELGKRKAGGGQANMIVEVAVMAAENSNGAPVINRTKAKGEHHERQR